MMMRMLVITGISKGVDGAALRSTTTPAARYRPTSGSVWVNDAAMQHLQEHFKLRGRTSGLSLGARNTKDYLYAITRTAERVPGFATDMVPAFQQAAKDYPNGITIQKLETAQHDLPFVRHEAAHREQLRVGSGQYRDVLKEGTKGQLLASPEYQRASRELSDVGYGPTQHEIEIPAYLAGGQHRSHLGLDDQQAATLMGHYCDALVASRGSGAARQMFARAVGPMRRIARERDPVVQKGVMVVTIRKAHLLSRDPATNRFEYRRRPSAGQLAHPDFGDFDTPARSGRSTLTKQDLDKIANLYRAQDQVHSAMTGLGYRREAPAEQRVPATIGSQNPILHQDPNPYQDWNHATHQYSVERFGRPEWQQLAGQLASQGMNNIALHRSGNGAAAVAFDPRTKTRHVIQIAPPVVPVRDRPDADQIRRADTQGRIARYYEAARRQAADTLHQQRLAASQAQQKRLNQTHERFGPDYTSEERAHQEAGPNGYVHQPDINMPIYNTYRPKPIGRIVPKEPVQAITAPPVPTVPQVPSAQQTPSVDPDQQFDQDPAAQQLDARQQRRANRRAQTAPTAADIPLRTPATAAQTGQGIAGQLRITRGPVRPTPPSIEPEDPFA